MLLVDDAGTVRVGAAKTWSDLDAGTLKIAKWTGRLDEVDRRVREAYGLVRDPVEEIGAWDQASDTEIDLSAEGQYKMKRMEEDPQLARQQAIEQARNAGMLDIAAGAGVSPRARPNDDGTPARVARVAGVVTGKIQKLRAMIAISRCYEHALGANPSLAGTVQTQFFIKPDGKVATASSTGVRSDVATCVEGVIQSLEFPKPQGGGGVHVNYPITMRI